MNRRKRGKTNSKRTKQAPAINTHYEAFRNFVGKRGSEIFLKHTGQLFSTFQQRRKNKSIETFFSSAQKKLEKKADDYEKFLIKLLVSFGEIDSSIQNLKTIPAYVESEPKTKRYIKAGLTSRGHLTYHIWNYLQEIYILKCRIRIFLSFLSKRFRKNGQIAASRNFDQCLQLFERELRTIIEARGTHVHVRGYSDKDLFILEFFDLIKGYHKNLQLVYELLLATEKVKRLEWIDETNRLVFSIVDAIFSVVNQHVLEE